MRRIPRTRRWLNAPARIAGRAWHCRQLPSPLRVQLPEQAVMNLIRVRHPPACRASPSGHRSAAGKPAPKPPPAPGPPDRPRRLRRAVHPGRGGGRDRGGRPELARP